jgi:hypothetical protein
MSEALEKIYDFDDVIDAWLDCAYFGDRHADLSRYFTKKFELLVDAFGMPREIVGVARGTSDALLPGFSLMLRSVQNLAKHVETPWSGHLIDAEYILFDRPIDEGHKEPCTASRVWRPIVQSAAEIYRKSLRGYLREIVAQACPEAVKRTVPQLWLFERGLPERAPDRIDYM